MTKALKVRRWILFKEWLPQWLQAGTQRILCLVAGHDPTHDQCENPEHDFCLWCDKSMPGKGGPR